jgi:hypothetical protein
MAAAGRTPGRAAAVPPGAPRPMARVAVRARPLPMARAGLPVLRRTEPARRAQLDAMVGDRSGPAVRQVRLLEDRALVTPAAGAPRAMNRAATAGPRSETVRTAAQEAVPVPGPGRQRPSLGGMPRTADATAVQLTVIPGVPRPAMRAAGHPARTARRGASALAARKMQTPASTGVGRGRRTASATARIRTGAAQGPIAAGQEQTAQALVVPVLAGRPGIEAVPVVPVPVVPVRAVPTPTGPAPTGRPRAAPVRAAPTPTGPAPTGRPRAAPVRAAPTPTGPAPTGRPPAAPVRAAPTPTGPAPTGRPPAAPVRAAPTPTGPAPTARAAVALPTVGRRRALVTAAVTAVTTVVVTVRRGRAAAVEVVPGRPTRRVRQGRAFLIRLPLTSSIPRHGPSSTACRTT